MIFFRTRNRFETERTYVPEARNATKNGVPMEEMNKTKNIESGENTESQDQVCFEKLTNVNFLIS